MRTLIPPEKRTWLFFLLLSCLLLGQQAAAGDCHYAKTFNHDLRYEHYNDKNNPKTFYRFSAELYFVCPADPTDYAYHEGTFLVRDSVQGKQVQEKIYFKPSNRPGSFSQGYELVYEAKYDCKDNPFITRHAWCRQVSAAYPHGQDLSVIALRQIAGHTRPYSMALLVLDKNTPPPEQNKDKLASVHINHIALKQADFIPGNSNSPGHDYRFQLIGTEGSKEFEDFVLQARVMKKSSSKMVTVQLKRKSHVAELTYQCSNVMDPILDPSNTCRLVDTSLGVYNTSLFRSFVEDKKNDLLTLLVNSLNPGLRERIRWEALAGTMRPRIFEGGKTEADTPGHVFSSKATIVLELESDRDIKRNGNYDVMFVIERKDGKPVRDINGKEIAMPYPSRYSRSSVNSAVHMVSNLAPGEYIFYGKGKSSLFHWKKTAEIPFTIQFVTGDGLPSFQPGIAILAPREKGVYDSAIPVRISLPDTMKKPTRLTLTWAMVGKSMAREVLRTDVTVQPGRNYTTRQDVAELINKCGGKAGEMQLSVSLAGSHETASVRFNVAMLGEAAKWGGEKKEAAFTLAQPLIVAPRQSQVFMAPAIVKVQIIHRPDMRVNTALAYSPFSTNKMALLLYKPLKKKPVSYQDDGNKATVIYRLNKPGFYRVRAWHRDKVSAVSQWRSFKVDRLKRNVAVSTKPGVIVPMNARVASARPVPHLARGKGMTGGISQAGTAPLGAKSINRQPGLPGKQMHALSTRLRVLPLSRTFQAPATVTLQVQNSPYKRLPFEVLQAGHKWPLQGHSPSRPHLCPPGQADCVDLEPDQARLLPGAVQGQLQGALDTLAIVPGAQQEAGSGQSRQEYAHKPSCGQQRDQPGPGDAESAGPCSPTQTGPAQSGKPEKRSEVHADWKPAHHPGQDQPRRENDCPGPSGA